MTQQLKQVSLAQAMLSAERAALYDDATASRAWDRIKAVSEGIVYADDSRLHYIFKDGSAIVYNAWASSLTATDANQRRGQSSEAAVQQALREAAKPSIQESPTWPGVRALIDRIRQLSSGGMTIPASRPRG